MAGPVSSYLMLAMAGFALSLPVRVPKAVFPGPESSVAIREEAVPHARNHDFLRTVSDARWQLLAPFLPREGTFTYQHTTHERTGNVVGYWRLTAAALEQRSLFRGPLGNAFLISPESQPIGLFAHQVMHRGTNWRRVTPTRFVPPGASRSSPVFVEWRREGGEWVISAFGDESFPNGETPPWCC